MLQHIFALIIKEFLALLKDKRSRFVLIGPPIVQLLVFGYAATFDLDRVPFAVYDEDNTVLSHRLTDRFAGSETFELVGHIDRDADIASVIDHKHALLVLHIGPHFSDDLAAGESASLQLIVDGRNSNTALLALNYVRTVLLDFSTAWAQEQRRPSAPAMLVTRAWYNSNLVSQWFIVPGIIGLLTLVVSLLVTALSVAREREEGTFDQLLVTPLRPVEILIGKSVPGLIIGLLESSFIILVTLWWFEVPLRGHIGALYLGLLLFLLANIGITTANDGTLSFDSSKLQSALASDFQGTAAYFAGDDASGVGGMGDLMDDLIDSYVNTTDGLIETRKDGIQDRIDDNNERIDDLEAYVATFEDNLQAQFTALESAMATLRSQQQYLAQFLAQAG